MMNLLSNLLSGDMPEALGLLLFGIALIAVTAGTRWVLHQTETPETGGERLEN